MISLISTRRNRLITSALGLMALTAISQAHAAGTTQMPIVGHYDQTVGKEKFKVKSRFLIPENLIERVEIATPERAFMEGYPNVFLQNERMVVCNVDCDREQNVRPRLGADGNFTINLKSDADDKRKNRELDDSVLRQTTVYHWVDTVLRRFQSMGHSFQHRLVVRVDREVADPYSGVRMDNNAFFIDADLDSVNWSLNFLPPKNSLLVRAMVGELVASAYDPTVAMHEATHFLFQEMIGEILNPEIYGLHEAFADYFSLTTIGDSEIGRVMFKGKPLRKASEILEYTPGMEAHDLGNVVLAGLWHIRELFNDKALADQIAFDTIRDLSRNPYTAAGDIILSYGRALEVAAPSLAADSTFREAVAGIWSKTKLVASAAPAELLSVMREPLTEQEKKSFVTVAMTQELSPEVVAEWGMKQRETVVLTQGPVRQVPMTDEQRVLALKEVEARVAKIKAAGDEPTAADMTPQSHIYEWRFVAIQDLDGSESEDLGMAEAVPFWILKNVRTGTILGAYTLSGSKVMPESSQAYRRLLKVTENLAGLVDYTQNFGSDIAVLLSKGAWSNVKARRIRTSNDGHFNLGFSDKFAVMTEYRIKPKVTFIGWLLGLLGEKSAKNIKAIKLMGVSPDALPANELREKLPRLPDGNVLVGYEYELKTGLKMAGRLVSLGE